MHVIMHLRYRDTPTSSVTPTRQHWSQPFECYSNNSHTTGHCVWSTSDVGKQCDCKQIIAHQINHVCEFWQLFEIWKFSDIFIIYIVSFICINHIGLMVIEWNKLNLQNKIHRPDQLLIGGYRRGGLIFRIAVFMQSTGPRNCVIK